MILNPILEGVISRKTRIEKEEAIKKTNGIREDWPGALMTGRCGHVFSYTSKQNNRYKNKGKIKKFPHCRLTLGSLSRIHHPLSHLFKENNRKEAQTFRTLDLPSFRRNEEEKKE
jgi:hypothetical protein